MFKELSEQERKDFKQWARDNYRPGGEINEVWHPVIQRECARMDREYVMSKENEGTFELNSSRDSDACPEIIQEALRDYEANGHIKGDFVMAMLKNDLTNAIGRADSTNFRLIPAINCFIFNRLDSRCWGNPKKVEHWISHKGRSGCDEHGNAPEPEPTDLQQAVGLIKKLIKPLQALDEILDPKQTEVVNDAREFVSKHAK